ncbi:MAG: hypothetical protein ABMA64_30975 [Myxococcota bacterium]
MTWRPWVIATLGGLALLLNVALLQTERIPREERVDETRAEYDKELRAMQYLASQRRANFEKFGMTYEMAEASAGHIGRFEKQRDRFAGMLEQQAAELGDALCPSDGLPQPYASLAYLVTEENQLRRVVDWSTLQRFERASWFDQSLVPALYNQFERVEGRRSEATLMAVSAALLRREGSALDGESPWATGLTGTFGFSRLVRREPRVEQLAIEYFGLMHFLTEVANGDGGICR